MHRDSCGLWAVVPPTASVRSAPPGSAAAAARTQAAAPTRTPMDLEEEEEEAPSSAEVQGRNGKGKGKKRSGTMTALSGRGNLSAQVGAGWAAWTRPIPVLSM